MLALISIPHQTPPHLTWYDDRQAVIDAANDYAGESDRPEPGDFDDAVHCLADDWSNYLLVENAGDVEDVRKYVAANKHQAHRVSVFVDELGEAFPSETIPDGIYFFHPEGGAWIAARYRGGCMVARTEEAMAATHAACNDDWAGIVPSDDDEEVDADIAAAMIDDDIDASMVVVTRAN